jgi:type IV pilus assembly protein PilQ
MEGILKKIIITLSVIIFLAGCATPSMEGEGSADSEFSEFDNADATTTSDGGNLDQELSAIDQEAQPNQQAVNESSSLDESLNEVPMEQDPQLADQQPQPVAENLVLEEPPPPEIQPEIQPEALLQTQPETQVAEQIATPPPQIEPAVPVEPPPVPQALSSSEGQVNIKSLRYKGFEGGGTLTVEGDSPMTFVTRKNANTNQFIVEIPNSKLSKKASRPLNTRDIQGGIGAIDPYQNPGSTTSRIVLQLREGAADPVVQSEGNVLMIIAEPNLQQKMAQAQTSGGSGATAAAIGSEMAEESLITETGASADMPSRDLNGKILSTASLQEFLGGDQKFYGKKISIEVYDAEIRDIIKFISEESGVNLVLGEDVKGKLSLKLKEIPWDQALVIVMKAKKLGYSRQGDVLRIAQIKELQDEELSYQKILADKQSAMPLTVKMFPISYSKVDDLVNQIKPFLTERGKIVAEGRTSSIVISDTPEGLERARKLIQSLDIPPAQVLIEGKVVEASDTFSKSLGINWATPGESQNLFRNTRGQQVTGNFANMTSGSAAPGYGNLSFAIQQLDFLGDFNATLSISESEGKVKVLSSPRVLTLHNEPAEITQSTELPYLSYGTTTSGAAASGPTVQFKNVQLKLSVTPLITNDASVIMNVNMMREFAGQVTDAASGSRPINKREAKTKVIVKNGQTAVIGGIYQSDSTESTNGIPGLSKIPVLGWMFKNNSETMDKNELLIFLTPRIVGQADSGVSAPAPVNMPATGELKLEDEPAGVTQ